MTPIEVMTALFLLFPNEQRTPHYRCLRHRAPEIQAALTEAAHVYPNVPTEVLAAVGFMESHLGCAPGSGGNWGAPRDAKHRHIAGTPLQAARILNESLRICRTIPSALRRFRVGLCHPRTQSSDPVRLSRVAGGYEGRTLALVARLRSVAEPH